MTTWHSSCPNNAACPTILPHPDGFLIVGTAVLDSYAAEQGANVAPDEAAVLLPQAVMAEHEKPLRDRIAQLDQQLDEARAENDKLFINWQTEKSGRETFQGGFEEVRAERDELKRQLDEARRHATRFEDYRNITRAADNEAWAATNKRTVELEAELADTRQQLDEARSELGKLKTEWAGRDRDWPGFDITPYSSETVARDNAEWHQEIVHRLVGEWRAAGPHHTDTTTSEGN